MTQDKLTVADDVVVSLEYVLQLGNGQEVDRSAAGEPLQYLHGHHQIIPGLESALDGMKVGDEKKVVVAPTEGYGERDPEQVRAVPRSIFPADMTFSQGETLRLRDSQSDQVFQTEVVEVHPTEVVLDFNHPLAGETLHFDVRIAGVRPATADELAHQHAHGAGGAH